MALLNTGEHFSCKMSRSTQQCFLKKYKSKVLQRVLIHPLSKLKQHFLGELDLIFIHYMATSVSEQDEPNSEVPEQMVLCCPLEITRSSRCFSILYNAGVFLLRLQ